jgi:hypothetical protein
MKKYTLADYAFQLITVTAGVLIALFIDGLSDWNNNRALVATARQMIAREVADNLKELEDLPKKIESSATDIENGLKLANDLLAKGKSDIHEVNLNFDLADLSDASWQSADRTGALAHMAYDEVRKYAELYSHQALFVTQQRKNVDLVASSAALIAPSFDPTTANKQDVEKFREQLMQLQANVYVTGQLGGQMIKSYREFRPY